MKLKEEHEQLTKQQRLHGLTVMVAIITVILMFGAVLAIVIRAMIN